MVVVTPKTSPPMLCVLTLMTATGVIVPPLPNWAMSVLVSFVVATLARSRSRTLRRPLPK